MVDYAKIHRLVLSDDAEERNDAVYQITKNFKILLYKEKEQAWKDLLALTKDEDSDVRWDAVDAFGQAFQYITDKNQATKDLLELTKDKHSEVRMGAVGALGLAFQYVTDKDQTWKDLLARTKDDNVFMGMEAFDALGLAFQYVTDKDQAWKDLLARTKDDNNFIRFEAVDALGRAFQYVIDKDQAWKDLLARTRDDDSEVRMEAVDALGRTFQYVTDKEQTWKDLLALTKDENDDVRWGAASALGLAFQYVTDKVQASKDLLALTNDEHSDVRRGAADALDPAFQYIASKEQATKGLLALTKDKDSIVRVSANYSLGKISIYKATESESEDGLKEEMDKAIRYFEKTSQEPESYFNPAKFCLPFYRSYNAVIFRQEKAEEEIERNLEEAKHAVAGSKSKEKLLEAVENLANALQEAQKLQSLDEIKSDLNAYRRYCDRTVELLNETEGKAPGAAKLMRRGVLIIDERIKAILAEIQGKAEAFCKETKSTSFEDLGKEANRAGKELILVKDPIGLEKAINNFQIVLSDICHRMPEEERSGACELLEIAKAEQYLEDKIDLTNMILSKVSSQIPTKQKSGIREELVVSVGGTLFGTGVQHNITIPLQEIAYDDLKNDLKKIGNKDVFDLTTLPPKLYEKATKYIDKIKSKR